MSLSQIQIYLKPNQQIEIIIIVKKGKHCNQINVSNYKLKRNQSNKLHEICVRRREIEKKSIASVCY